jgi:hypothetical protein
MRLVVSGFSRSLGEAKVVPAVAGRILLPDAYEQSHKGHFATTGRIMNLSDFRSEAIRVCSQVQSFSLVCAGSSNRHRGDHIEGCLAPWWSAIVDGLPLVPAAMSNSIRGKGVKGLETTSRPRANTGSEHVARSSCNGIQGQGSRYLRR